MGNVFLQDIIRKYKKPILGLFVIALLGACRA